MTFETADAFAGARAAALAGESKQLKRRYEAVRFNPHHPVQARFSNMKLKLRREIARAQNSGGTSVFVATLSAMFDPEVFVEPKTFRVDREVEFSILATECIAVLGVP